jgi:predicted ATPase
MMAGFLVADALRSIQTVEISPAHVGALQDPTSTHDFEPDGSNTASVYDGLDVDSRSRLLEALNAVIGGIEDIDVLRYADKMTLQFTQTLSNGAMRKFHAKQMSDGTLRAFGILLATVRQPTPQLLVIEEPEIAVHLGALRVLVEILQAQNRNQVVITTHSADVVDMLPLSHVRVVWAENGESRIAEVSAHTHDTVLSGLITPGELLRTNALDPQTP